MAPRSHPREFMGKTGKIDFKNFDFAKFDSLPVSVRKSVLKESINAIRECLKTNKYTRKTREARQLLDKIDEAKPEYGLGVYSRLVLSRFKRDSEPYLNKEMLEQLKQDDPYTFDLFARDDGWELRTVPDGKGGFINTDIFDNRQRFNDSKTPIAKEEFKAEPEIVDVDSDIRNINPAEPTTGSLSSNPINNAPPVEASPGALTNPPSELSKIGNQFELPNVGKTIEEAAASAYTGNEPPIADYNTPIIPPGVHVGFDEKPINITPEGITVPKPNSASPSPEAIGEAMRDAIKDRVGDTQLNKEDIPAFLTKEEKVKAAEDATKAEAKTETAPDKTEPKTTPETPETPQGLFSRLGGHIGRNLGKYLLGGGLGTIGWAVMRDLASDDSRLKSLFNDNDYDTPIPNTPPVTQPRNEPATNEEYVPGKIPSYIPQDNLPSIKESTASKKVKSQPQVVNTPASVNNATADYVRAAYNSYIPSDAGRAYQKAIYGDPLELDRMRLQQQQQKWRDFVMRSGQSPAELVQRGLMPYDALQYV